MMNAGVDILSYSHNKFAGSYGAPYLFVYYIRWDVKNEGKNESKIVGCYRQFC